MHGVATDAGTWACKGVSAANSVKTTTISDKAAPCPLDHVNRQFKAPRPNVLWLSDFTYVATWTGFVYGRLRDRRLCLAGSWAGGPRARRMQASVCCSMRWSRHCMIDVRSIVPGSCTTATGAANTCASYTRRLAEAGVEPSVGSVGGFL